MEEPQNIRIQFQATEDDIRLVRMLFEQSGWTLTEVDLGAADEGDNQLWTLMVTEEQRDSINFMVEGDVITLYEVQIQEEGAAAAEPPRRWKFRVFRVTDEEDQELLNLLERNNWQLENFVGEPGRIQADQEAVADGDEYPEINRPCYILVPPREDMQECPDCFARPCVTHPSNQQGWWPLVAAQPAAGNNVHRKDLYYKFWNMCYIRGVWADERYIQKKEEIHGEVNIRREIMPDCVCRQVRFWYPNPPNVPYMGHKIR